MDRLLRACRVKPRARGLQAQDASRADAGTMKDTEEKLTENAPGKYYVTRACIGCTLCAEIAPDSFRENTDLALTVGNNYVYRQPETAEAERLCRDAMDACPSSAIRDDGGAAATAVLYNEKQSCARK